MRLHVGVWNEIIIYASLILNHFYITFVNLTKVSAFTCTV